MSRVWPSGEMRGSHITSRPDTATSHAIVCQADPDD